MSFFITLPKERMDYSATSAAIKPLGTVRTIPYLLYQPAVSTFLLSFWRTITTVLRISHHRECAVWVILPQAKGSAGMKPTFSRLWLTETCEEPSKHCGVLSFMACSHSHSTVQHFPTKAKRKKPNNLLGMWTSWWWYFVLLGFKGFEGQCLHLDGGHQSVIHRGQEAEKAVWIVKVVYYHCRFIHPVWWST